MGTQQILLIVLSVIIVGVAIAVGISMFNSQAYNSNKTAVAADVQTYGSQVVQYYKTPTSQGGAGQSLTATVANPTPFYGYMGWTGGSISNDNGNYAVTAITETTVVITGYGKTAKGTAYPSVVATITFPAGTISPVVADSGTAAAPTAYAPQ